MRSEIKPTDAPKPYAEPIAIEPLRQKLERLQLQVNNALMMLDHWRLEPMKFGPADVRSTADFCLGDFAIFEISGREGFAISPPEREPRQGTDLMPPETALSDEVLVYLSRVGITTQNIGPVRRSLLMPFHHPWNGWIRDITAQLENKKPGGAIHLINKVPWPSSAVVDPRNNAEP